MWMMKFLQVGCVRGSEIAEVEIVLSYFIKTNNNYAPDDKLLCLGNWFLMQEESARRCTFHAFTDVFGRMRINIHNSEIRDTRFFSKLLMQVLRIFLPTLCDFAKYEPSCRK